MDLIALNSPRVHGSIPVLQLMIRLLFLTINGRSWLLKSFPRLLLQSRLAMDPKYLLLLRSPPLYKQRQSPLWRLPSPSLPLVLQHRLFLQRLTSISLFLVLQHRLFLRRTPSPFLLTRQGPLQLLRARLVLQQLHSPSLVLTYLLCLSLPKPR